MSSRRSHRHLDEVRHRIVARVRALRLERGWTQAELGKSLGLSQARLSEIERGGGSFTAEQLVAVLELFNVGIGEFLSAADPDDELQNSLIQLGAAHLRQVPGVATTGRYASPSDAILATLLGSRAPRMVTALAPVVVQYLEDLSLPSLRLRLSTSHRDSRLGWLLENVREALSVTPPWADSGWRRRAARMSTLLDEELAHFPVPSDGSATDLFDPSIRSKRTRDEVWGRASPTSRRWGIVSELQPEDFRQALWSANGPG